MPSADLSGPLQDFLERAEQIRAILSTVEAAGRGSASITTQRPNACLEKLSPQTSTTANSMSMVYLASSFEEFIRQEIEQCAIYFVERYSFLDHKVRHHVRNRYWQGCLAILSKKKSIMTEEKQIDPQTISDLKIIVMSTDKFVFGDDVGALLANVFCHHSNNFKPGVVDEIAGRLGINGLVNKAADSNKLKLYFGVGSKKEVESKLVSSLNEFYDLRNQIVHQLNANTGYGVDAVVRYIELFEATCESIAEVLSKTIQRW